MAIDTGWGTLSVTPQTNRHVVGDPIPGGGAITYKSIAPDADGVIRPTAVSHRD